MKIQVQEKIKVQDKIFTYKVWIGKLKHFFTVKLIPPRHK